MVQIKHFFAFILGVAAIAPAVARPINTIANGDQLEVRTLPIPIPPGRKPPPSSSGSAQSTTQHGAVGSLSNKESEGFMTGHCSPHLPPPPPGLPCPQHSPPVGHIVPQQSGSSHPASDHHNSHESLPGSPPSDHHANGHVTTWLKNVQTPSASNSGSEASSSKHHPDGQKKQLLPKPKGSTAAPVVSKHNAEGKFTH